MTHPWGRALLVMGLVLALDDVRADEQPAKPGLAGYRTVKDAATREIVPTRVGQAGGTGYLGVSLARDGEGRLVVEELQPGSPAARAGVEKGDLLTHVDGKSVKTPEAFRESLQMRSPGESVKLALVRGGKPAEINAVLSSTSRPRTMGGQRAYLGLVLGEAKAGEGVRIDQVMPESPAAAAGFKPGDQIFQVEGVDFTNASKLADIMLEKKPGDEFEVTVRRPRRGRASSDHGWPPTRAWPVPSPPPSPARIGRAGAAGRAWGRSPSPCGRSPSSASP